MWSIASKICQRIQPITVQKPMASTEKPNTHTYRVLVPLEGFDVQIEEAEQALRKAMREHENGVQKYKPAIITHSEFGKCLIFRIHQSDDDRVQVAKYRIRCGIKGWLPNVVENIDLADYAVYDDEMFGLSAAQTLVAYPPYSMIIFKKVDQPIQHVVGGTMSAQSTAPAAPEPEDAHAYEWV